MVAPKGTFQTRCLAVGMGKVEIKDRDSRKGVVFVSLWSWVRTRQKLVSERDIGIPLQTRSEGFRCAALGWQ